MEKINAIILAAGKGTRMKSELDHISKVGYPILGVPVVKYVVDAVKDSGATKIITVIGHAGEYTKSVLEGDSCFVWQHEQKGTGHAVKMAKEELDKDGLTIVLCGDAPLIRAETLQKLIKQHKDEGNDQTLLSAIVPNPFGYGRILRDASGKMVNSVEQTDASEEQAKITEVNTGVVVFNNKALLECLDLLHNNNKKGEYYLTQLIAIMLEKDYKVNAAIMDDYREMAGINDRNQLAHAQKELQLRINLKHMLNGVSLLDTNNTYIGPYVKIGCDTYIEPNVMLFGNTVIGKENHIGMGTTLKDVIIGDKNTIMSSDIKSSTIMNNCKIGPFTHIREGNTINDGCKVGSYVEIKKVELGKGSKIPHLSYVGDTKIGERCNIGAGTITANYDGVNKFNTVIEDNVFVGTNSTLVAPITLEKNSFVAAGSTITEKVASDDLAIGRARQVNKTGYARKYKK